MQLTKTFNFVNGTTSQDNFLTLHTGVHKKFLVVITLTKVANVSESSSDNTFFGVYVKAGTGADSDLFGVDDLAVASLEVNRNSPDSQFVSQEFELDEFDNILVRLFIQDVDLTDGDYNVTYTIDLYPIAS